MLSGAYIRFVDMERGWPSFLPRAEALLLLQWSDNPTLTLNGWGYYYAAYPGVCLRGMIWHHIIAVIKPPDGCFF